MSMALAPTPYRVPALRMCAVALVLIALIGLYGVPTGSNVAPPAATGRSLPLAFVPNVGQAPPGVALEARSLGGAFAFTTSGVQLAAASGARLRVAFIGANETLAIAGAEQLARTVHFYGGNDPARWHSDVPAYGAVLYRDLYPGIDLRYDGDGTRLKSTYFVAPGADPSRIGWRYAGAEGVSVTANGDLAIALPGGQALLERAPIAWQETNGQRIPVAVRYALVDTPSATQQISFALGAYDRSQPLVIDPDLVYSSYVGGNSDDNGRDIAIDAQGNIYITGYTYSDQFLSAPGGGFGSDDVFIAKFDPTGKQLLYSAYIGGKSGEQGHGLAVTANGEVVIVANTSSLDFPVKDALFPEKGENRSALVKLAASGELLWSTYLPVTVWDSEHPVALDAEGNVYVTGQSFDAETSLRDQIALLKISPDGGQLLVNGHVGGDWIDKGAAVAIGPDGKIYLTGTTELRQEDFPITENAFQPTCGAKSYGANEIDCDTDGFVMVVSPDLEIVYSTLLGGKGSDTPTSIGIDGAGNIYVAGRTSAQNFPTLNAIQGTWQGEFNFSNAFVTKINVDGSLGYSTYLASTDRYGSDQIDGIAVKADGTVALTGLTNGEYFPVKGAHQNELGNGVCNLGGSERLCYDAFVTVLAPDGTLASSSYHGGGLDDFGKGVAFDKNGNVWMVGSTEATNMPTTSDAFQKQSDRGTDAFLASVGTRTGGGPGEPPPPPPPPPPGQYKALLPWVKK